MYEIILLSDQPESLSEVLTALEDDSNNITALAVESFDLSSIADGSKLLIVHWSQDGDDELSHIREIKSKHASVPIVVVSERSDFESKELAYEAGCDDFIVLPESIPKIVMKVRVYLGRHHDSMQEKEERVETVKVSKSIDQKESLDSSKGNIVFASSLVIIFLAIFVFVFWGQNKSTLTQNSNNQLVTDDSQSAKSKPSSSPKENKLELVTRGRARLAGTIYDDGNNPVTDDEIESSSDIPIQVIDAKDALITDSAFKNLRMQKMLKRIRLSGASHITDKAFLNIDKVPYLSEISIPDTKIGDPGLSYILKCKRLTTLNLARTKVSPKGLKTLGQCKSLRCLSLAGLGLNDKLLASLVNQLPRLIYIDISDNKGLSIDSIKSLAKLKDLKGLTVYDCEFNPKQISELATLLPNTEIFFEQAKPFPKNYFSFYTGKDLANLIDAKPSTTVFNLNGWSIKDKDLFLLKNSSVKELSLKNTLITKNALGPISQFKDLQKLYLGRIPGLDITSIFELRGLHGLRQLSLHVPDVSDSAMIQMISKLPLIEKYSFTKRFSPDWLVSIDSKVKSLELTNCMLNDSELLKLSKLKQLKVLTLWYCPEITIKGIEQLIDSSSIRLLNLQFCNKLVKKDLEELANSRKKIQIIQSGSYLPGLFKNLEKQYL